MCLHSGKRGGEKIGKLYIERMAAIGEAMQEGPLFKVVSLLVVIVVVFCGFYREEQHLPSFLIDVGISIVSYAILKSWQSNFYDSLVVW